MRKDSAIILGNKSRVPVEIKKQVYKKKVNKTISKNTDILIWINTYERPKELQKLLGDIYKNSKNYNIKLLIFDDCSKSNYEPVIDEFEDKLDIEYFKLSHNHGKIKYWKLCSNVMRYIKSLKNYDYYIKLDDDLRLENRFFERCINLWNSIKDGKKVCLNFRLDSREGKCVWTGVKPRKVVHNPFSFYKSQWVDCDFFVERRFFEELNWEIETIPVRRWRSNPTASSGVGWRISKKLYGKNLNLYLTTESLVQHKEYDSKMNPEERNKNPLITKPFKNKGYGLFND